MTNPYSLDHARSQYLQGVIDCLYQDAAGDWHVLDYKTADVTARTLPMRAAQYQLQLYVYALAAERVLGIAPRELTLVFLRPGLEWSCSWDDAARSRVTDLVNAALARISPAPQPV